MDLILKKKYIKHIDKNINTYNLTHENNKLKIATYNVRYWTNLNNKNTMDLTLNNIFKINADVIFLQEVMIGSEYKLMNGENINSKNIIEEFEKNEYKTVFCNVLPTWFSGIYGNMLCIKNNLYTNFDIENITFAKSKKECIVSGNIIGTKETRCCIIANSDQFVICGVHLDICSEFERNNQINQILNKLNNKNYKNKIQIILGDFNSTDINNYNDEDIINNIKKYVYNNIKSYKYKNIINTLTKNGFKYHKILNNITTWSCIQTDYIFVKIPNKLKNKFNIEDIINSTHTYYSYSSDHLPLILNI